MGIYVKGNEKQKKKILKSIDLDQDLQSLVKEWMLLNLKA